MGIKEGLNNFLNVLVHPVESYRKMVSYDGVVSQRDGLQKDIGDLVTENYESRERAVFLQDSVKKTNSEYGGLKRKVEKQIADIMNHYKDVEGMMQRARENASSTDSLGEWQRAYAGPLEERMHSAEKETEFLRNSASGIATDVAIQTVVNLDPRIKKVPFIFYNDVTKHLTYTPETLKFFGIDTEEAEKLNFTRVLRRVAPEYLKGPEGILSALATGEKLSHYDAKTCGENPIDLKLTSYPVREGNRNLGFGILLYDPKVSLRSKRNRNLIESLDQIFHSVVEELNERFAQAPGYGEFGLA